MTLHYAEGVHAAVVGTDLVLLDLASDAYSCLPDIVSPRAGWSASPTEFDADTREILSASGLASRDAPKRAAYPPPPLPTTDLRGQGKTAPHARDLVSALRAALDLKRAGADASVSRLTSLETPDSLSTAHKAVCEASACFAEMLPWFPVRSQCLHRTAALRLYLARQGLSADWVFGVRTWSFRAHCWMQSGDVCLNDDVERLRAYVPIMTIPAVA